MENAMASNPPQALRVTLVYDGAQITVAGAERVAMTPPASAPTPPQRDPSGYWLEVHDADGRIVYYRPLHQPIRTDVEAFSPDARASITRVPVATRTGSFSVLVPDTPDARVLELHGPADPRQPMLAAGTLLRTDVDRLRRMKPP
jgi:hypothetical protein